MNPTPSLHLPATAPFDLARAKAGWPVVTAIAGFPSKFDWVTAKPDSPFLEDYVLLLDPANPAYRAAVEAAHARGEEVWFLSKLYGCWVSVADNNPQWEWDAHPYALRSDLRPLSTKTGKEVKPCAPLERQGQATAENATASVTTGPTATDSVTSATGASSAPASVQPAALGQPLASRRCVVCGITTNELVCCDAFCAANTVAIAWHNPDNLPSPGDGKRFLVKGELPQGADDRWGWATRCWVPVTQVGVLIEGMTYRTSASRPLPDATDDPWLPIASYDRALHGEWVETALGKLTFVETCRWWVDKYGLQHYPTHFRPIPTTPPASGETGTPRCDMHKVDAGWILASHSEGEFVPLEKAQSIERDLHTYRKESSDFAAQIVRERQSAQAQIEASRAECEALRRKKDEREQQLVNKIAELDARIAQASALLLVSADPFDKACDILKS